MTPKVLSSQTYVVTSLDDSGRSILNCNDLSGIFRREAARRGFELQPVSHWVDGGLASFNVTQAVTFNKFREMMDDIAERSGHSIYVALDADFKGQKYMQYPQEKAALSVRDEAILKSYPSR